MRQFTLAVALGVLCFAPFAYADTVNMTLTSAGNVVMGGVYVNPYTATVGGVTTKIICDDFLAETYVGESWTANVTTLDQLSGTKWGTSAAKQYNAAAWLISKLLSVTTASQLGQVSFAIWGIFTPSALDSLGKVGTTDRNAAQSWINQAMANNYAPGTFSNFVVYTPVSTGTGTCGGRDCGTPQEFMGIRTVSADEASAAVLLGVNLSALLGLGFLLRRRIVGLT